MAKQKEDGATAKQAETAKAPEVEKESFEVISLITLGSGKNSKSYNVGDKVELTPKAGAYLQSLKKVKKWNK